MPVHDWTRLTEDEFRDFRFGWLVSIRDALNRSLLPGSFYASIKSRSEQFSIHTPKVFDSIGAPAVSRSRNQPSTQSKDQVSYAWRSLSNDCIAVCRKANDQPSAYVEVLTHEHKSRPQTLVKLHDRFEKLLEVAIHLLVIDLTPPCPVAPLGSHAAFWSRYGETPSTVSTHSPYSVTSYQADIVEDETIPTAYFESVGVGQNLPKMPLFLSPDEYVPISLQESYDEALRGAPRHYLQILEPPKTP